MYKLELTSAEYEQLTCDLEQAREELEELSGEIDWFVTDSPERITTLLAIIRRAEPDAKQVEMRKRVAAELMKPHSEAFGRGRKKS